MGVCGLYWCDFFVWTDITVMYIFLFIIKMLPNITFEFLFLFWMEENTPLQLVLFSQLAYCSKGKVVGTAPDLSVILLESKISGFKLIGAYHTQALFYFIYKICIKKSAILLNILVFKGCFHSVMFLLNK